MPENTAYVGRPSKWGNPFVAGRSYSVAGERFGILDQAAAAEAYRRFGFIGWHGAASELRGKNLACWCPLDTPCHADVLLEWANG
jgi:hypothetical protein